MIMRILKYLLFLAIMFTGCSRKFSKDIDLKIYPDDIRIKKGELFKPENITITLKNNTNKNFLLFGIKTEGFDFPATTGEDYFINKLDYPGICFILFDSNREVVPQGGLFADRFELSQKEIDSLKQLESKRPSLPFDEYRLNIPPGQTDTLKAKLLIHGIANSRGEKYSLFGYYMFKKEDYKYYAKEYLEGKFGKIFVGVIKSNKIYVTVERQ